METGTHALRLIATGVFDRFPKLRVVLGHMGETLPIPLDRIDNRYLWQSNLFRQPRKLKRLPSEYLRENFIVTSSGMNYHAPLMAAIEAMGEDKVLFAVDHPMENQSQVVAEAAAIPLSPALSRKFYETNSMRVFRLKQTPRLCGRGWFLPNNNRCKRSGVRGGLALGHVGNHFVRDVLRHRVVV